MNRKNAEAELNDRQWAFFEGLLEVDPSGAIAAIYYGGHLAERNTENPEGLYHAAHSLRELMEKVPKYLRGTPVQPRPQSLLAGVRRVGESWTALRQMNPWEGEPRTWSGEIDGAMRIFLVKFEEFYKWSIEFLPTRSAEAQFVRSATPGRRPLPPTLNKDWIKRWNRVRRYMENGSHHGFKLTPEEFAQNRLEMEILLQHLSRVEAVANQERLDEIIREGEGL